MRLVEDRNAPPHAIVGPAITRDGIAIRVARWPPALRWMARGEPLGTVVVCNGRTEFIEKYYEVAGELAGRGFAALVFDWRGQGLSDRLLRDPRKGHVGSFADYGEDLAAVASQVLAPFCPRPWYALAHSMGGPIVLQFAARRPDVFERLVLSAPMIGIAGLPFAATLRATARLCRFAGLSRGFVPGGRRRSPFAMAFDGNPLTSDAGRFARMLQFVQSEPRLGLGAPTIGWLHAAFDAMAEVQDDGFVRAFAVPTLTVMPALDRVVDGLAAERLAQRLRGGNIIGLPGCRHEILMENDALRQQFWAAFDAFVPGRAVPKS